MAGDAPAGLAEGGPAEGGATGDHPAIWLLALGQTLGFACLYYSFAAMLVDLEAGLGWTKAQLALGPTLALLIAACAAPMAGRLVDRGWGGEMLVGGPLLGAAALATLSGVVSHWQWLALWAVVGVAQSGCLYDTCFAFLTRRLGAQARPAIIRVTLVAGLASTLAFPLGAGMGHAFGWQGAVLAFAGLLGCVAAPVNLWAVRRLRRREAKGTPRGTQAKGALAVAMRRLAFWQLAGLFGLAWLNHSLMITYAVPLLTDRGGSAGFAVFAASCIGPSQVAGRFLLMMNEARVGTARATMLALGAMLAAAITLSVAGLAGVLVLIFAVLQGAGIGLMSILRPVLAAEVLGRHGFGAISGALAVAPLLAAAAAPYLGARLLREGGASAVILACAVMALVAFALAVLIARQIRRATQG